MYYGPDIMEKAGIVISGMTEEQSALLLNIPLSAINGIGTCLAVFYIDKLGRRYIILRMVPFMAISWWITAVGMALTGENHSDSVN